MEEKVYQHDDEIVTLTNRIVLDAKHTNLSASTKVRLPRSAWKKKFEIIHEQINHKKWNSTELNPYLASLSCGVYGAYIYHPDTRLNTHNRWAFSIGDAIIQAHDGERLKQILYRTPPPLTIQLIRNYDELEMKHDDLDMKIDKILRELRMKRKGSINEDKIRKLEEYFVASSFSYDEIVSDVTQEKGLIHEFCRTHLNDVDMFGALRRLLLPMEMGGHSLTLNKTLIYHDTMMGDIRNKKLSHLTAMEHESNVLIEVLICLNDAIKEGKSDKIQFWQKYAELCLVQSTVRKCITLRVAITADLYFSLSQNLVDLSMVEYYVQLTQTMNEYNESLSCSNCVDVNKWLSQCSDEELQSRVQVVDEMKPQLQLQAQVSDDDTQTRRKKRQQQAYRIYLLSPYRASQTFVRLCELSDEHFEMQLVTEKNKHLWHLSLVLPPSVASEYSRIRFECVTIDGKVAIHPRQPFCANLRGYYYVKHERDDDGGAFALFNRWDIYTELRKASSNILHQLCSRVTSFESYSDAMDVLLSIRNMITTPSVWKKAKGAMMKHDEIANVLKLLLYHECIRDPQLSLTVRQMYRIIEIFQNHSARCRQIGIALYRSFAETVHRLSSQRRSLSSADYLLLYPIFNLFCYFERMIRDHQHLTFRNYHQYDEYFLEDKSWMKVDFCAILNIDLDLESPTNYQRRFPFENQMFRLCCIMRRKNANRAAELFRLTVSTIARRGFSIWIDLFNSESCVMYLFSFVGDDFATLWKELIVAVDEKRIATHARILSAFDHHLEKQIDAMNNENNHKLAELYAVVTALKGRHPLATDEYYMMKNTSANIMTCNVCSKRIKTGLFTSDKHNCKFCGCVVCGDCSMNKRQQRRICDICNTDTQSHDILDTVNMRLAVLQNNHLVQYVSDKQCEYNLYYMLHIVLRGDEVDPHLVPQLITFMVRLMMHDEVRNIALRTLHQLINKQPRLSALFKEALKRTLSEKLSLAKRICMFLDCPDFYRLESHGIQQCFVDRLHVTEEDEVQKWHPQQAHNIHNLARKYAPKNSSKTRIHLWDQIFEKLIRLPQPPAHVHAAQPKSMFAKLLPIYSGQVQEQKVIEEEEEAKGGNIFDDDEDETGNRKMFLSSGDLEINPKHVSQEEEEDDINPYFVIQLEYCIAMEEWANFAATMKHVPSLRNLMEYVQGHLRKLNGYISNKSKHLTIKHLDLFMQNKQQITKLASDCEYNKYFDDNKMNQMIDEYRLYTNLKRYFIRFLARFTKQNEDAITKETHDFVAFVKNWDLKLYSEVKGRREWNQWLQPQSKKLSFLFEFETSNVFFNIWCGERRKCGNTVWNVNNYMNVLYPKAKKEWDHLIARAALSQLTFDDVQWFQHLDLLQELHIMQLPPQQATQIQNDIDCSLRIDDYVDFVESLTRVVDIFVLNGKTEILRSQDVNWEELKGNLAIARKTMGDKSQSIADIAQLFSAIVDLVGVQFDAVQKQWIKTIVVCKETVHRMATDDHFKKERFRETLQLLDDSNDGEMTQLSGSLRSAHTSFVHIWNTSHKTKTHLMRFFASIELKLNDVYNLRQIHDAIPRIKNIVAEVGKMAKDRDMQKLDKAMSIGYFNFDTEDNIQRRMNQTNQIEIDQIAKQSLHLDQYSVPQMQGMIDIILLCRNKGVDLYDEEQKKVSYLATQIGDDTFMDALRVFMTPLLVFNDTMRKHKDQDSLPPRWIDVVQDEEYDSEALWYDMEDTKQSNLAKYLETTDDCKLIQQFINENEQSKPDNKDQNVVDYIRKIDICKEISEWRIKYILKGGRMLDEGGRIIKASSPIQVFNDKQKEWQKRVLNWSEYVLSLRNDSHLFNYFTINQIRIIINKLNLYKNTSDDELLFQELMGQFRFARPELKDATLRDIIRSKWNIVNENSNEALVAFNTCFSHDAIMNIYNYCDKPATNKTYELAHGVPNLLVTKERSQAIFDVLHLYSNTSISSHQVLLCNKSLSSEDIFIFIFRCLQNEKRFKYNRVHQIPIYCLLFPEDLDIDVLDKTVHLFNQYLLSKNKKSVHYSLMVLSCKENNTLCHRLTSYRTSITFDMTDDICGTLFNGANDNDILKNNKPFVQLYQSSAVGMGKSYMIKQMANKIHQNQDHLIRIPFNSPNIDLDFIVSRLYTCYDGIKSRKTIYHLDISSSATNSVNYVLFSLLFLRYIRTPRDRIFSVNDNMAFLIEEPTDLASLTYKTVQKEFYILHAPMQYPIRLANSKTNPFLMDEDAHYAAKFLHHYFKFDLRKEDPDPINQRTGRVQRLTNQQIHQMIRRNFPQILKSSPIRQKAFWEYLYTQFVQVVHSVLLNNEWHRDDHQHFNKWKHLVTESIIDLAEDFSKKLYDSRQKDDEEKKYDESDGTEHFHLTKKWQRRSKPIALLNQSADGSISFLVNNVNRMDAQLKQGLEYQKFNILGWDQQQTENNTKQKKIELLLTILGTRNIYGLFDELLSMKPYCDYALTFDNMLKMIAIFFRVKANIPVILMGETGCGKTCLLNYLAKAANIEIERADVHGGFTAEHIRQRMRSWIKKAKAKSNASRQELDLIVQERTGNMKQSAEKRVIMEQIRKQHEMQKTNYLWIFFDEINTSPDIGYFKEIVCDQYFDGEALPSNMKVIAACNPYRKRNVDHLSEKSILNDPLAKFVYRVYPLPSTMKEYVWMFGSLSANDEAAYASQMCQTFTSRILHSDSDKKRLSNCIVAAQGFVRKTLRDSAMVSLRDMARCLKLFVWIYEREKKFNKAMIMCIALVYYFRLDEAQRKSFSDKISQNVKKFQKTLIGKNAIIDTFCAKFKGSIPKGIALNRALKENLFLLFLCIQTKTPLILIGKPGSSKTLAMSVIREYLSDHNRRDLKQDKLLPIHVVSFQCSAQSRAEGIQQRWAQTQKFAEDNKRDDTIYVLLLDEIGLAEHSAYRPLKVLHQLLEINPLPISFIGLSNWSLDAAKMNRAICHLCPTHSMEDLVQTGIAMAEQYADNPHDIDKLKPKISLLSNIYTDVMDYKHCIQPRYDFFGARDFYSVVRHFLTAKNKQNKVYDSNEELIMYFLRNFGGIVYERIDGTFASQNEKGTCLFDLLCTHMGLNVVDIRRIMNEYSPSQLVSMNLDDKRSTHHTVDMTSSDNFMISRHVMAITEYYNSWNVLLDSNIITHNNIFIFGSEFERDKSNSYLYLNKVKNCMETGKTLILCNLEEIHESLYDMLNQRYTYNRTSNKMYCRIALGSNSERCFVDPSFKCMVITTKSEAHKRGGVPIAFLNRFEKQLVSYYSSLKPKHNALLCALNKRISDIYCIRNTNDIKKVFPGFCKDTFASLIVNKYNEDEDEDTTIQSCIDTLKEVALTEALIQSAITNNGNSKQNDDTIKLLPTLQSIMKHQITGKLLVILTFDFASKLEHHSAFLQSTTIIKQVTDFSKADEFALFIHRYLKGNNSKGLLLQYRHQYPTMNHFIHIKHILTTAFNKYATINPNNTKKIAILVHLRRSKSQNVFPLILSNSSKTVFLDSLSQIRPIELKSLATQTIEGICNDRGVELLTSTFQRALSHLQFTKEINVEHEIKNLSQIFEDNANPLQTCIMTRLMKLLSDNKINRNVGELVGEVVASNNRWSRGSFYEQLYDIIDKICVVAVMRVLQTLYENNNIGTIHEDPDEDTKRLFIELYSNFDLIEVDPIRQNLQNIIANRPNKLYVKYDYCARFPFSKTIHNWCDSHKSKLSLNQSVMDSAQTLKREMSASMPAILNELPIKTIELYIHDLIRLKSHQLQIDRTWPLELFQLITKYVILLTSQLCDKSENDGTISIAELETVLFYKHGLLLHLIRTSSMLPLHIVRDIRDMIEYPASNSLDHVIGALMKKLVYAMDTSLYQLYNANSIDDSIQYIAENIAHMKDEVKSNEEDQNDEPLAVILDVLKLKMIAIKHNLDISKHLVDSLFDIYEQNDASLCDTTIFNKVLQLFIKAVPNTSNVDRLGNVILCDLFTCIDDKAISKCHHLLNYVQYLVDLLCKNDKITQVKWNKTTEYEITKHLFEVLSHESIDTAQILNDIQREQSELAGMIIQSMNYKRGKHSKKKPKPIKFVRTQEKFNEKLGIRAPLIQQFNPQIYDQAMESITIPSFFKFFRVDSEVNRHPLLTKIKQQPKQFWMLPQLPDIAQWIKLIHSKYMGTLSTTACAEFTMDHVFKQCQLHKWGDPIAWKRQFTKYKESMNAMSSKINLPPSDHGNVNIPISCSLMGKHPSNKQIKNTVQCIADMIDIHNDFVQDGTQVHNVSFFDLRKNHLIDTNNILNIIRSNAKAWICFDVKGKAAAESYIIFDLDRIENEIRNKCIFARYKLRIKYHNFDFVGSKNMLQLIQSIKIKQETLNYEIWHSFDSQFESNLQRKRALTVIEDVIALLCSSTGNKQHNDDNHEFYYDKDDDDDDKEDEKDGYDGRATDHFMSTFMRRVGGKMRKYDPNEELWHFMLSKLKISKAICNLFRLRTDPNSKLSKKIELKHIQSLWNELIKRIDGEMIAYEDQCLLCLMPITDGTPIKLECCGVSIHYDCLKQYIQSGFGNNGDRITLQQLSCLLCRHPMRHKAANDLFKETQILYDKVSAVALKQLRRDNKMKDAQVRNPNGAYYNNPAAYAMKLYAFFLCFKCKEPYFFGTNQCGDEEAENNVNKKDRLCSKCDHVKNKQWLQGHTKQCPKCERHIEKNGGCNHMTCRTPGGCGHEFCWLCLGNWYGHNNCVRRP
eukprot:197581_1